MAVVTIGNVLDVVRKIPWRQTMQLVVIRGRAKNAVLAIFCHRLLELLSTMYYQMVLVQHHAYRL